MFGGAWAERLLINAGMFFRSFLVLLVLLPLLLLLDSLDGANISFSCDGVLCRLALNELGLTLRRGRVFRLAFIDTACLGPVHDKGGSCVGSSFRKLVIVLQLLRLRVVHRMDVPERGEVYTLPLIRRNGAG